MCRNYLSMHNLKIPKKLKDKWQAISEHKTAIKDKVNTFKNVKAQPMTSSMWKMIANIMTSDDTNLTKIKIHIK